MKKFLLLILFTLSVLVGMYFSGKYVYAAECNSGECGGDGEYQCGGDPATMCCTGGGCPSNVCNNAAGCVWDTSTDSCLQDGTDCGVIPDQAQCVANGACRWVAGSGCGPRSCAGVISEDDTCSYCVGGGGNEECTGTPNAAVLTTPLSPANGITTNNATITYDWNGIVYWGDNCGDADYRVVVYSDSNLTNIVVDSNNLGSGVTSWTNTGPFVDGQTYWWRVRTSNENNTAWSPTWTFVYNVTPPPACTITGPTTIAEGVQSTWNVTASDPEGTINRIDVYRRMFTPPPGVYSWGSWIAGQIWQLMGQQNPSCGGSSCAFNNIAWTPPADGSLSGKHWLVANVWDTTQSDQCSGNPEFIDLSAGSTLGGFKDCGNTCRMQVTVEEHDPPVCQNIYGSQNVDLVTGGNYTIKAWDPDNDAIAYSWGATCGGTLQTITQIQLRVRGTLYNGVGPAMQVYLVNANGTRNPAPGDCPVSTISTDNWVTITCNVNKAASSIDVVFINDAYGSGQDRNLYVNYITLTLSDGTTRTIQAESNVDAGDKVLYDIGDLPIAAFDGANVFNVSSTSTGNPPEIGQTMNWNGSLRFPVPIKFTGGSNCSVTGTTHDVYNTPGGSCPAYAVTACGGVPPAAATPPIYPPDNAGDVPIDQDIELSWSHSGGWGNSCVPLIRDHIVRAIIKNGQTCPDPGTDYGLYCDEDGENTSPTCTDGFFSVPDRTYCWYVTTTNNEMAINSEVWEYTTENPTLSKSWVTSIGGGAYANGVIMEFPENTVPGDFAIPYLAYEFPLGGAVLTVPYYTSGDTDIIAPNNNDDPRSESGLWVENADFTNVWPESYINLEAPPNAIDLDDSDCGDIFGTASTIDTDKVYKISVTCMNDAIAGVVSGEYKIHSVGTVVIYVEADGNNNLRFDNKFQAQTNKRLVIISEPLVEISKSVGLEEVNPTLSSDRQIEASIVALNKIRFLGTSDASTDPDQTILVEGPIMSSQAIEFNRNRGDSNAYPSEMVRYNAKYLYDLTSQERDSDVYNLSGLFVTDIDYVEDE